MNKNIQREGCIAFTIIYALDLKAHSPCYTLKNVYI